MNVISLQQEMDLGLPRFEDFWLLWFKKVQRKDAERLFSRLRDEHKLAAIVAAAEWRSVWEGWEPDFRPNAVKWIQGERWEDELPREHRRHSAHQPMRREDVAKSAMPEHVRQMIAQLRAK
jgi:hypothetical protein